MDAQTYFYRRTNTNAKGEPRSWTDHLLWHHACHTVDLFQYQTGESANKVQIMEGPKHPGLGIAMDMSIGSQVPSGALCTLTLSFNNNGPFGTVFRYICDNGTYIARYDDLVDGWEKAVDLNEVALAWVLCQSGNIVVIPGTANNKHREDNFKAGELGLSDQELNQLNAVFQPSAIRGARYTDSVQKQIDTKDY